MRFIEKIKISYQKISKLNKKYDITTLSASTSFYIIIALFSLMFLFMQVYNIFSKEIDNFLLTKVVKVLSDDYEYLIEQIMPVFRLNGLFGIVIINLFWSCSKIIMAQKRIANKIYGYSYEKFSLVGRINSFLMFAMLIAIIVFELVFLVYFNQVLVKILGNMFYIVRFLQFSLEYTMLLSLVLLSFMYVVPVKMTFKKTYKGALITTSGFFLITYIFIFFIKFFLKKYVAYGIASIISLLFGWIYLINIIIIIGIIYNYSTNKMA